MEGPSLVILKEELEPFLGRRVLASTGNSQQVKPAVLKGRIFTGLLTWGKHLLLQIGPERFRIHFLMYGSYRINERKLDRNQPPQERAPRLRLTFAGGNEINFYSCSIKPLTREEWEAYDWSTDPLSPSWNELKAVRRLGSDPGRAVCDALMDQTIFSGVGNIIKNEVLFRQRLHPLTPLAELSRSQVVSLVRDARKYCFQFYEWKKIFELKKHWLIYRKKECPECGGKPVMQKTGQGKRVSFFCPDCQPLRISLPNAA